MVAVAKLPVLNPNEFELWKMRIEQYFLMTDYVLWEVILNGDSPPPTRSIEGVETPYPPTIIKEKLARKNELKARVNIAHGVSAASSKTNASNLPNVDSLSDAVIYSFFASQASKHQDNRNRKASKRTVPVEDTTLNALVTHCDGLGYDWSDQAEDGPTNFALMAYTSSSFSSSSNSDTEVSNCSKARLKSYETLKEHYDNLTKDFNKSQFNLGAYKAGLESVEARLEVYKKNEAVFTDAVKILKLDVMLKDKAITELRQKFEKAKKERDDLKLTLEKFEGSSKNLSRLLNSQQSEGYHEVSPPYTRNYMPPKPDLVFADEHVVSETFTSLSDIAKSEVKTSETKLKNKKMVEKPVWNNARRVNHQNSQRLSHPYSKRNFVPKAFLTNYGLKTLTTARHPSSRAAVSVNTARSTNTAYPRSIVNGAKPILNVFHKSHSPVRGTFNQRTTPQNSDLKETVNTAKVNNVTTAMTKAVVSVVQGNGENVVKFLACWIWRPTENVIDYISKDIGSYILKRFNYVDLQGRLKLGHINFKTINKLVRGNLVRGLPSKIFENDDTCVACQKGKQHKASYKTKLVSSISQPLQMLHMNLFGPTFVKSLNKKMYCLVITDDFSLEWLFDIDSLTKSMNYELVTAGNQTYVDACIEINVNAGQAGQEKASDHKCILLLFMPSHLPFSSSTQSSDNKDADEAPSRGDEGVSKGIKIDNQERFDSSTQDVNTDELSINTANTNINIGSLNINTVGSNDPSMPSLEETSIFDDVYDDREVGAEADTNNLELSTVISLIPTTRVHKDHPKEQIIRDLNLATQTMRMINFFEENVMVIHALTDPSWIEAMQEELLQFKLQKKDDRIFISQDKYVADILKKFDFTIVKTTASTPMEPNKALIKDAEAEDVDVHLYISLVGSLMYLTAFRPNIMFAVCACARFQVTPKTSHLHAVKRIFSDYVGASLDRKFTRGGCQFLGKRLVSWQCKKQTIVSNSTTEAEYVAAASCCGQAPFHQRLLREEVDLEMGFVMNLEFKLVVGQRLVLNGCLDLIATSTKNKIQVSAVGLTYYWGEGLFWEDKQYFQNGGKIWFIKVKTINEDVQVQALVDGKKIIINKASIRRDLRLDDAEGTRKHKPRRKQRKATEVPHTKLQTEEHIPTPSHDLLPSGEDRMQLSKLMEICTKLSKRVLSLEQIKTNQAAKIKKLKKRVKNPEGKKKKRTHGLKRLYKGRIAKINADEDLFLINKTAQDQGRMNDEDLFGVNDLDGDEVIVYVTVCDVSDSIIPKLQTAKDILGDTLLHYDAEIKLMNLILLSIPNDIYISVDACTSAKDMWKKVERLMRGTIQNKVDRETCFINEFDQFVVEPGEALVSVYNRFAQLMNDLERNDMHFPIFTINTKFLNSLQPEWLKYQFEKLVNTSRANKLEKSHDPLALVAHTGSSSRNTSSYYVTHPTYVVDYDDEYQLDDIQTNSEDPLTSAMTLRNSSLGNTSTVQCYNCSEKGHSARNCPKPRVRDSKYFMEQMLLAKQDEAGVILTDEQNDFLFANASRMEEIKDLSANICLMARIQPTNHSSDVGPSYDSTFVSEVQSSSINENEEQMYPTHTKIINSTIGDDQIDSNIIFYTPNGNVNSGSFKKDTHVPNLCALEQLARNAYQEAEKQ
nr:uncharacterized mitochondrial protein AtMg00810-like [Tanacetum cinerariifolium]